MSNNEGSYANVTFSGSYTINGGSLIFTDIYFLFPSTDTNDIPTTSRFVVSGYGDSIIEHCIFEQVDKEIYSLQAPLISFKSASHSVTNSEFTNILRTDDNGKGGIFYLDGWLDIIFTSCNFTSCSVGGSNSFGGCIFIIIQPLVKIISCCFTDCTGIGGGGALATTEGHSRGDPPSLIITSSTFSGCVVTGTDGQGGAVYCSLGVGGGFVINGSCSFSNCEANGTNSGGGAIYLVLNNIFYGYFTVSGMSFTSCSATEGSNIFIKYNNTDDLNKVKDVSNYSLNVESYCWGVDVMIDTGIFPDDVVPLSSLITTLVCPLCSTYTTLNDCISEGTENTDVCFWLYNSDSESGDDGWCKYKKDYTIPCSDVKRQEQCGNYGQSAFSIRCKWESSTCEEITLTCSDLSGIDICDELSKVVIPGGCFWLYDSGDTNVNTGTCRSKTDDTLTCASARRPEQCTLSDVTKLGSNCFWLMENGSVVARCEDSVC
jgi:hypothetical protein